VVGYLVVASSLFPRNEAPFVQLSPLDAASNPRPDPVFIYI
jgi:hypothetical protein